jgi:hypothetical protein
MLYDAGSFVLQGFQDLKVQFAHRAFAKHALNLMMFLSQLEILWWRSSTNSALAGLLAGLLLNGSTPLLNGATLTQ